MSLKAMTIHVLAPTGYLTPPTNVSPQSPWHLVFAFLTLLCFSEEDLDPQLLLSFLVFLPKKTFLTTPSGLKVYAPLNLRPLNLSNTFIKIIALASNSPSVKWLIKEFTWRKSASLVAS